MEQPFRKYPISTATFSKLREGNYLYVDKSAYVYNMTHDETDYMFLSRPRRFGKSLLVSTLHSYFSGRKDLFKGLAIEKMETEWTEYPVLHFDMSTAKHVDKIGLENNLSQQLSDYEDIYGTGKADEIGTNQRLLGLIKRAYEQTGKKVVVLIDEYDAPLLDVIHEDVNLPVLRNVMRNFYSPLKACDPYLRFVFLTGITKFSQLSIFSELNNIKNISMDERYAAICGITEEEMLTQIDYGINSLAEKLGVTHDEAVAKLKYNYDGYHFMWPSPDIYNPFSLLNSFADRAIKPYWFESGTPTFLIEMLNKYGIVPSKLGREYAMATDFDAPTERMVSITPLLYQSGYVTIKDYNEATQLYTLDIPNHEILIGLYRSLLPYYVQGTNIPGNSAVAMMYGHILDNDMNGALRLLQEFLSTVPYCDNTDSEGHYQQMMFVIFSLLGYYVDVEVRTPRGRVDMVMRTATTLYVIELKLNKSAQAAMQQIDLKSYPDRFRLCGLPIVKIGINFDSEQHTISDWKIQ